MRWAGHMARMEGDVHMGFWWGTSEGNNDLENLHIDEKIKMDLMEMVWTGLIWLMIRTSGGLL